MAKAFTPNIHSERGKGLTKEVAEFVHNNKYNSIPKKLLSLEKTYFRWFWFGNCWISSKNR